MRLTPDEIAALRATAASVFGPGVIVRPFDSRADDAARLDDLRVRFVDALHDAIGEQRIGGGVRAKGAAVRPIDAVAIAEGIRL